MLLAAQTPFQGEAILVSTSKIFVDLKQRTFTIEVPDERLEAILDRIESLFKNHTIPDAEIGSPLVQDFPSSDDDEGASERPEPTAKVNSEGGRKRAKGNGKARSWELVDLPMTVEQRQALRGFFSEKSPATQNDQVAVVAVKLKEFLGKSMFSGDEIHSAFKIVDLPTPKNLPAVFTNMKKGGISGYSNSQIVVSSHTEDYVSYRMSASKKKG
ncbi:hypothetical protein ACFQU1_10975 [Chelatococcus sp. GCM10030263]|uniref:hypothetical protein n=1 Tax=Chelatococcus sp. GCM10030263 TaxID=3273387 RepID=UPI0036157947